jgi:hypothetical protein
MYTYIIMRKIIIYVLVGIVITLIAVFTIQSWLAKRPEIRFGKDRAAVITQTASLGRFETARYSIDKIIEASTSYSGIRQFLFGDKILLVAHGDVIAGFDLSILKPENFQGTGRNITISLPAPMIFSTIIDNDETRVFDRKQGILTKGDLNLEANARQEAESAIRRAACDGGILGLATDNVKKQLEVLFKSAGFESVTVVAVEGKCE